VAVGVDDVVENTKAVNLRCFEGVSWVGIETYKHRGTVAERSLSMWFLNTT
jgi:uncharacterized protein YraI